MAKFVIKKDGTKEPFDEGKIKRAIAGAAQRTELSEERKTEVVEQVLGAALEACAEKEEIATSEIRANVLSELGKVAPSVLEEWKRHEQEK